eukprot:436524-Prymnesium_polylepis.1
MRCRLVLSVVAITYSIGAYLAGSIVLRSEIISAVWPPLPSTAIVQIGGGPAGRAARRLRTTTTTRSSQAARPRASTSKNMRRRFHVT